MSDRIKIDLREAITDFDGKPLKDFQAVKEKTKWANSVEVAKTMAELEKEAPDFTYGKCIFNLLSFKTKPENAVESADINRVAKNIKNIINGKHKGIWDASETELLQVEKLLGRVSLEEGSASGHGEALVFIQDKIRELKNPVQTETS